MPILIRTSRSLACRADAILPPRRARRVLDRPVNTVTPDAENLSVRARIPALLSAACLLLATTALNPSAEAADVETLRARAQAIADRVTELERELSGLRDKKSELETAISSSGARIGILELRLDDAEESLQVAQEIVEARAAEVYKSSSTGADLEMLLAAESMSELALIAEVQAAAALADQSAIDDLTDVAERAENSQSELEERKSNLLEARAEIAAVESDIAGSLDVREDALAALSDEIKELQQQARLAAEEARSGTVPSNLPAPTGDLADRLVGTGPTSGVPGIFTSTGVSFEGEASWYGPGFEGNLTANGDVYDSSLFTAASKTLPLNTYLYIEYEGRGCVVLINDRGPYVGNRILDLSRGTAAAIGMEHAGVGWVTAEIIFRK
jgi:peptidoglycan hydrolase CwlO-like protein